MDKREYIEISDINENIAVIKINRSYRRNMSELELYDVTRGFWKRKIESVEDVEFVLSVVNEKVIEVYRVFDWVSADKANRVTIPYNPETDKGRIAFNGKVAADFIRNKYIGKYINKLYKKGEVNPLKVFRKNNEVLNNINMVGSFGLGKTYFPVPEEKLFEQQIMTELDKLNMDGKTKEAMVKVRVNQGVFRDRLLSRYKKCCLCNVNIPQLLVASHIKPWSVCQDSEKLLVDNGFLMCPNHDSLFDKGLITFNDNGRIIISDKIDDVNKTYLNIRDDIKINVIEGNIPFLKYHRENVYVGD